MENTNIEKITIILLNYNGWQDTIECIESVLRNDYPNYQVIVVDNNSPNNSMEYIKAWAEGKQENLLPDPSHPLYHLSQPAIKKPIPYIYYTREEAEKGGDKDLERAITKKWQDEMNNKKDNELISTSKYPLIFIQTGENLGFAGGNNVGIKYALKNNNSYVCLINNDTVVNENFLYILINAIKNKNKVGVATGKIYYYDYPNKLWYGGGRLSLIKTYIHFGDGKIDNGIYNIPSFVTFVSGCFMFLKVETLKNDCFLPENYFLGQEDCYWSWKIKKKGWQLLYVPEAKIWHKISKSRSKQLNLSNIYYNNATRLIFLRSILPKPIRWAYILFIGMYNIFISPLIYKYIKGLNYNFKSIFDTFIIAVHDGLTKTAIKKEDIFKINK
jgi:GT2 family glycosyltransferase